MKWHDHGKYTLHRTKEHANADHKEVLYEVFALNFTCENMEIQDLLFLQKERPFRCYI